MPDFGSPVAGGITAPNPNQGTQTLSSLMGVAGQAQNLQIGQQQLQSGQQQLQVGAGQAQQAQQQMAERQIFQQAMAKGVDPDGNPIKGANGEMDPVATASFANKYMPLTGQGVVQSIIKTQADKIGLNDANRALGQNQRNDMSGIIRSAIGTNDPNAASTGIDQYVQQNPSAAPAAGFAKSLLGHLSPQMPQAQRDQALQHLAMQFQPSATTANQQAPSMVTATGPGGGVQAINVNPNSATPVGAVGGETAQGLSPEAGATRVPVFQNGQAGTVPLGSITPGAPGYGGNNPFGSGRYGSQPGNNPGFAPSGASMGTPEMYGQMNDHWTKTLADAGNAQNNIGLANNIKAYADQALTGKQVDKLTALNGILSIFGERGQTDVSTATDLLNKNMARLSLSSRAGAGGTDAAGMLATAANPHGSMTAPAIKEAADQVISSQKMALAQQKLLQPYRQANDAQGYQGALSQFNTVADPRLWQYADMNAAQRQAFRSGMNPADRKEFGAKMRSAEQLGVVQ